MPSSGLPDDVVQFIGERIDSVEQLEVLLLLHQHSARDWTAEAAATVLYSQPSSVGRRLAILQLQGLLDVTDEAAPAFRYAPKTPEIHETVNRLAAAYKERRVSIVGLIASKPMDNVRAFADAFRIVRKKEE